MIEATDMDPVGHSYVCQSTHSRLEAMVNIRNSVGVGVSHARYIVPNVTVLHQTFIPAKREIERRAPELYELGKSI